MFLRLLNHHVYLYPNVAYLDSKLDLLIYPSQQHLVGPSKTGYIVYKCQITFSTHAVKNIGTFLTITC